MVVWSPQELRRVWTRRFLRNGGNGGYTRLFVDHDDSAREKVLAAIPLADGEVPVFASIESEAYAVLITTRRVVANSGGLSSETAIDSIRSVTVDIDAMRSVGRSKRAWDELQIDTLTGGRALVRLEPGLPLFGIWNALLFFPSRRRRGLSLTEAASP